MQIITPRKARKTQRREGREFAEGQINKILQHLDGIIQKHETPAQCVKRLVETVKPRGEACELVAPVADNCGP